LEGAVTHSRVVIAEDVAFECAISICCVAAAGDVALQGVVANSGVLNIGSNHPNSRRARWPLRAYRPSGALYPLWTRRALRPLRARTALWTNGSLWSLWSLWSWGTLIEVSKICAAKLTGKRIHHHD
jgi:hypothetical protein